MVMPLYDPDEDEFASVPVTKQLDHDDDGSDDTNALTDDTGADNDDLDNYRDLDAPVWEGPE
jgi:hypothetical protein